MVGCAQPLTFDEREKVKDQKFYVTTAIAYLNGPPHVGHAYEFATADVIARYHTIAGRDTKYVTGSDEHGQKIANTAEAQNITPLELCERNVKLFQQLNSDLNLSDHRYIRTTEPEHKAFAQWLWKRVEEHGDIYLDNYEGWYNVREENFLSERDAAATNYKDPETGKPYERRNEESYFFRMSKYHDAILDLLKNTDYVQPTSRRNELIARLEKAPLEDLSISRTNLKWGIPVPGSDTHVMYVWFDALSNYASAISLHDPQHDNYKYWPADVHIVGKDIIWFHCVIWPAMLMAAKIPTANRVFGHGFVQAVDGSKMSKSLGNVIDPLQCLSITGSDTFRYYMIHEGTYGSDVKFSNEALLYLNNSDLCSNLGNLVHRVTALCGKACDGKVPEVGDCEVLVDLPAVYDAAEKAMGAFALQDLCAGGMNICRSANQYLAQEAPWKVADMDAKRRIIRNCMEMVYLAAHFLWPIIPSACDEIFRRFGSPRKYLWELKSTNNLITGASVTTGDVLFKRLETLEL